MSERGIYMDDLAEMLKPRAGEKYRPSNGSEGDIFYKAHCAGCTHDTRDNPCRIWTFALALDRNHADYPKELQYGADGQPTCTSFEAAK